MTELLRVPWKGRPPEGQLALFVQRAQISLQLRMLQCAYHITRDWHTSEDVVQEALMALCRNLRAGKLKGDVCPWLMTVTVNLAVTHARKARVRDAAAERAVHQGNVEAADSGEDASFLLAKALVKLPERQREAVSLVVLGGLSYKEAAGRLGSEESTVRKQVSDARAKLRFLVAEDRKGDSS